MNNEIGTNHGYDRIATIDVMRGLAILGIFAVNIFSFHTPYLYADPVTLAETAWDKWVYAIVDILAQASFYPLFAFLFGYGLIIIKERVEARGELAFYPTAIRRMIGLLLLGMIHAFFIWPGDILVVYAILGIFLLAFTHLSAKGMTITAIVLYTVPNLLLVVLAYIASVFVSSEEIYPVQIAEHVQAIYQNGSFLEITNQRIIDWSYTNWGVGSIQIFFMILPLLLLGAAFAKQQKLIHTEANTRFFKKMFCIALPIGLVIKLLPYLGNQNLSLFVFQDLFGGPIVTAGYISLIYLIANKWKQHRLLLLFANVGRLSLSNYLFQSLICSVIFYSYGFSLYGKVSYVFSTFLAICIFLIQLYLSKQWLKSYQMGPVEWLLRGITYGKISSLKRREQ
ncbi:DUF418 domain-containing protein [Caldibacillus lycopersici]|uniref:DUF418 domain-containing protein n=1 Tax=Perspicuibacillus lycopersici TaxID=1325689 RepID=A0AAE3ISA0_9BACI|nr:DUF418 domain-containing protein [Perspicuibacillus lycopersici]MCU9612471.1 DUF418 domain-containing protein [Perspicuibacillus lycopersici]